MFEAEKPERFPQSYLGDSSFPMRIRLACLLDKKETSATSRDRESESRRQFVGYIERWIPKY